MAYGNEPSLKAVYLKLYLLVRVGPVGERGGDPRKLPPPSKPKGWPYSPRSEEEDGEGEGEGEDEEEDEEKEDTKENEEVAEKEEEDDGDDDEEKEKEDEEISTVPT